MQNTTIFNEIASELGLGNLAAPPTRVSGGLMHKMYCLETASGKYAIKLLNPAIMRRPDVFDNYQTAECLEMKLQTNEIPIVSALAFDGKKMQCSNNQYYYIFDWIDGKALCSDEIKKENCELMGAILAKIHKIEQLEKSSIRDDICIDWDSYITLANEKCPEIAGTLKNCRELLYNIQNEGNLALKKVPAITSICNGDMDSKNVLWMNGQPKIIDLECLSYGNPFMELFELALCWSGYEHYHINYELLKSFIMAYSQQYGNIQVDWDTLYSCNFGRLEWLEYNIKRALRIECENDEEQLLGIEQVKATIDHVIYYNAIKDELLEYLNCNFN